MNIDYRASIMHCDTIVATVQGDTIVPVNKTLMPLYMLKYSSLEYWLATRSIDLHRTNSRLLRKALRLQSQEIAELVLTVYAATITDTYWVRPENSTLEYKDVRFSQNYFDKLALCGSVDAFTNATILLDASKEKSVIMHTPELTNIGSFEKCWRNENGAWWMYKQSSRLALFSELFVYELGKALHFPMAQYEKVDANTIRTLDFTQGASVNFEPAFGIVGDSEDYVLNYNAFLSFGQEIADEYLQIILMDGICQNVDRHTANYGVLRDIKTGEIVSMAPNYDNNLALVSNEYPKNPKMSTRLQSDLRKLEEKTGAFTSYAKRHKLPVITPKIIQACIEKIGIPVQSKLIEEFVMFRYQQTPVFTLLQKQKNRAAR